MKSLEAILSKIKAKKFKVDGIGPFHIATEIVYPQISETYFHWKLLMLIVLIFVCLRTVVITFNYCSMVKNLFCCVYSLGEICIIACLTSWYIHVIARLIKMVGFFKSAIMRLSKLIILGGKRITAFIKSLSSSTKLLLVSNSEAMIRKRQKI